MVKNYSHFYIKLFENPIPDGDDKGKTKEFKFTVKLNYPIRGAEFIEIGTLSHRFSHNLILLVKCDLVDQNCTYTNVKDGNTFDNSNVVNSQIIFVGCGGESISSDLYKIDQSKSLINEFSLSVKKLDGKIFNALEIEGSFLKIKIYHE